MYRYFSIALILFLAACAPATPLSASMEVPTLGSSAANASAGFVPADGTRPMVFPQDFGAHEDFRTEWWYYTGNLQTPEGRHFGFELTIFRVGLLPPTVEQPASSEWYGHSLYFAHFALSDIQDQQFHAYERFSRPGPGLAGAVADPYRVWLEDWNITEQSPGVYQLEARQDGNAINLTLTDEMGIILHGENGYSPQGQEPGNASYYYSQPRLRAEGSIHIGAEQYSVSGLAWKDHEFSSGILDTDQIGWDWFSLQFEDGPALMLFQLRERDGNISSVSSGTYIASAGKSQAITKDDFDIKVLDQWKSPHTGATYPSGWEIRLKEPDCLLQTQPWMNDQEIHFPEATYWEGAVKFEGTCAGRPVSGNGYIELTGYGGKLPLP